MFECMFDILSKHPPTDTVKRRRSPPRSRPRSRNWSARCSPTTSRRHPTPTA